MRSLGPLLVLLGLGALAPAPAPATADPEVALTAQGIDDAIERGVAWVLDEQRPQGTWGSGSDPVGTTALAAFALLHCGIAEDQGTPAARRLVRALRYLDTHGPGRQDRREGATRTYETSLLLLLLRSRGRAVDRDRMQRLAEGLATAQARNGQWWYDGEDAPHRDAGDNSNTQFALLALGAAHGEGLAVPRAVFDRALAWWTESAQEDGGFGYASGGAARSASTGSMTAAGIACLALLLATRRGDAPEGAAASKAARVQQQAIAFLARVFSTTRNHGPATDRRNQRQRLAGRGWLHYYLWTVERAMVLAGQERLGEHDWYAAGARRLLATQAKDGSWRQEHPLYATCFALLFLTRAADPPRAFTPRAPPSPALQPPRPVTGPAAPVPAPADDPSAGAAEAPPAGTVADWLRAGLAPDEVPRRCRLAGPASLAPLVRALADPDRTVRQRAFEALTTLLPEERTRGVDRHPLPRGRLAHWLRLYARHLELVDGRFLLPR